MDLGELLGVDDVESTTAADFNIAPTKPIHLVFERKAEPKPVRVLSVATWDLGLAKDRSQPLFNVRSETVRERFANLLTTRRCLIPADGYYEWESTPHGRQPYYLTPADGDILAIAGIYRRYDDAGVGCAMLTGAATDELAWLHNRSPLVVPRELWSDWLDPYDAQAGPELLVPATACNLQAHPVSTAVNQVANTGPELIEPIAERVEQPTLF